MQSKKRNMDEGMKKQNMMYPFCIHDTNKEIETILIGPLERLRKIEPDIEREAAKLRYLDRRVNEETVKGNRYGATRVAEQWWNRLERLDEFLKEQKIDRVPAPNRDRPLIYEDGKKEDLSVEIGFDDDDTDDKEMMLASGLTKNEKQYILDEAKELRYIDAQIKDDMRHGNQDDVDFWQQQYSGRLSSLRWYMDRKGLTYSFRKKKNMTEEKMIAKENHEKKCTMCGHKRRVSVMRSQSMEKTKTRSRERSREMP